MSVASTKNYVAGFINPDNVSLQALNLTSISPLTGESTFITLSTNEDEELLINDIPVSGGGGSGYALLGSSNTFTQPNLFNGVGPSTLQIGNSEGFTMSLTAIDTPNHALQISNGGLYLGNLAGSPEDSKFVLLSCDDTNASQFNIDGNLNVKEGTIKSSSGSINVNNIVNTNAGINNTGLLTLLVEAPNTNTIVMQPSSENDNELDIRGSLSLYNNEDGLDELTMYLSSYNDYANGIYALQIANGGIRLASFENDPTNSTYVLMACDDISNNQLNVIGNINANFITLNTAPAVGNDSNLVPTTAWVNAAIAAAIAAIP